MDEDNNGAAVPHVWRPTRAPPKIRMELTHMLSTLVFGMERLGTLEMASIEISEIDWYRI